MSWKFRVRRLGQQGDFLLVLAVTVLAATAAATTVTVAKKPTPLLAAKAVSPTATTAPTSTSLSPLTSVASAPPGAASASASSSLTPTPATPRNSSIPTIADICIHGIRMVSKQSESDEEAPQVVRHEREFVHTIQGDLMLSVLTSDPSSALFVINRVNLANLLEADFEIGLRAIHVDSADMAENLLLQEVQFMQQCITHAIGIFVDFDLYKAMEDVIKDLEYNIWPIPSPHALIFPMAAHLLYQMPWGDQIASVEILTESLDVYNEFMEAVRHEHMCLMHFKSDDNIYILFGNKMATHFNENGTIFAIPSERTDRNFIADLPDKSFILMENEIDLRMVDKNTSLSTLNDVLLGKSVLPSRVISFGRTLLNLLRWLKGSLMRSCRREQELYMLETCFSFLTFIEDWETADYQAHHDIATILDMLLLRKIGPLMNFQMYQKKSADTEPEEMASELREIASQNFVTNITTFYHYNRENNTSLELKTKLGQVFNCRYSAGENKRYPFLFDGESVMFWRIKPDAWVATGMTAAILGIIITLAILVFIVVRISLGDVFEGNPVTSILLLLSLVLLFTSFVPFSMEYVGERRNSHVTFEDAATLNTLCAVRVFIMTLVYCFTFSLLLCRAVMLASIGSEGGFLSHVNGYIQAVICIFSIFVQMGMSVQLLVVMHVASESVSCENMYYGGWLWALLAYDFALLLCIVSLIPLIYRSQRNYREGILIVIGAVLVFIIWIVWITLSLFGDEMRDAAIPLGLQATGWAVLIGVLIPRTFLIVRGIERSDIAQALPSLTSLAFAQNNQYSSEQSVYECVNPAMRNCSQDELHQSPSEIPTLPLRGGGPRRQQFFANLRQANANINPSRPPPRPQRGSPTHSLHSSLPDSPDNSKITRF